MEFRRHNRVFIGKGKEHQVWEAKNLQWVLKKPTFLGKILLMLSGKNAYSIRDEVLYSKSLTEDTPIRFPETHVYIFGEGKSYIIKQEKITPDELYWINPTKGFSRLYTRLGISWDTWISAMAKLVNLVKR